jgi:uncharacterized protein
MQEFITRDLENNLANALRNMPVVALIGPRQVGKTTLAIKLGQKPDFLNGKAFQYLDLELDSDLNKLQDAESFLRRFENTLLIIDEVQRKPDLFRIMRGLVDTRRLNGEKSGHFLLLGSASRDLLQQSSETLAGRIRYLELTPFTVLELFSMDPLSFNLEKLWLRGGFPDSYLAPNNDESWAWRNDFISTYVERDIPFMGPNVSATRMKRFWTMLAHFHGQQVVLSDLGKSLEVSHTTIKSYLDILTDFYMVRQIQPWSGNTKKRLIKSPKIFIRDTGLLHKLLNIAEFDSLLSHPVLGFSWEGFVIENIIACLSDKWQYSYYRTSTQVEIDLVLEGGRQEVWAVEVKRSGAPKVNASFHSASVDIKATKKFVVYSGPDRYNLSPDTEVIGLIDFLKLLRENG